MKLRPCIDIHNGKVKQIVGSSLSDEGDRALENFVSEHDASYYAEYYKERGLTGGHVIVLNGKDSPYYEESKRVAFAALSSFPGGMQYGGGVNDENAEEYLAAGASHVIATSFVFAGGRLNEENLRKLQRAAGKDRLVLDLSCRKKEQGQYYVVTDRWQKFTEIKVDPETLKELSNECSELLIHGVDVEGKSSGIDGTLIEILSECDSIPVTYAGGVRSPSDIEEIREKGKGRVDFTVGSALDLFGGELKISDILSSITQS